MDLLTLRVAAGGGSIDGLESSRLIAAGFTLLQRSAVVVRALAGRRAALLLPTSPQFFVALAAADGRGAVLINPLAAPAEVAFQLLDANVGAVFTVSPLARALPAGTVHVLLDEAPSFATVVAADGASQRVDLGSHFGLALEGDVDAPGRDEECAIVYTSAMSGAPRGAILTHRNLVVNARQTVNAAGNTRDDHLLAVLPFSHLFGLTVSANAPLVAGARVTTMPRFNPLAALDIMEREAITEIVGVPGIFGAMLAALERRGGALRAEALRLCICGGAPLSLELQERWAEATGVELRQGYGLTEASPVALFNRVDQPNRRGTLGLPFPGVRVSIWDPETGSELPDGEEGEIRVAGDTVFRGYVGDGARAVDLRGGDSVHVDGISTGLRVLDGWLCTGDRGRRRDDGTFEFRGVYKDMFTRNGFNIYPRELERVIASLPGASNVHVSAAPDPLRENDVCVELTGNLTEEQVKAHCRDHLAAYKVPSRIVVHPPSA
ncbi:MAG: AMP-binding protein [Gemmatimonadaceae bacterium]